MIDWTSIASIATAIGIFLAVFELRGNWKLSQSQFEDSLDQQYRELAKGIPVDALIGKTVTTEKKEITRELIYNYFDLSNEQVFLRKRRRIRKDTWLDWCAGIQAHLQKVEFQNVWQEMKTESPQTFTFLEKLEETNFEGDPAQW